MRKILLIFFALLLASGVFAQTDSLSRRRHNPKLAVYMSAIVPGAGQIYNGQWYKVPLYYAALGYTGYKFSEFNLEYWKARNDLLTVMNGYGSELTFNHTSDENQLISIKETYRSYRDMATLGFILTWTLNVIDAYVNAEFYDFDVSEDLSFRFVPMSVNINGSYAYGIGFRVAF